MRAIAETALFAFHFVRAVACIVLFGLVFGAAVLVPVTVLTAGLSWLGIDVRYISAGAKDQG